MPKLLDHVRDLICVRHYCIRTEQAYLRWIKQYIFFHNKRHPAEMGAREVSEFLLPPGRHSKTRNLEPRG